MISNMLRFSPSLFDELDDIFATNVPILATTHRHVRTYPQVNMGVTDKSVEVYLFVPGMEATSLDVSLEKNLLNVTAERINEKKDDTEAISRRERFAGRFKRVITLPEDVDPDSTKAVYKDGVLHISVAKREETLPRKIQVTV